ncbi:transposon conjugation system subunit ConC [Bacillus atrophaeus]|uniref:transposon conjugation system subunit ConC n=1 Tax=Bacillus atrophaeus TaxID=1452 RepID=UPI002282D66F|nr:transposon conjugation system subunit ConC [Bacillus atrophaeus]MCY8977772.1 transposon conjugation system subunit ConC [Bacillus atrophaeus]
MDFMNFFILGADLPTLGGVKGWVSDVVIQFITIVVMFIAAKNLMKLKMGGIIFVCCIGSAVTWVIKHWSEFSGWINALMEKL